MLRRIVANFRRQDWTAVVVELVVVVVGVFIGVQASNWNAEREVKIRRAQVVATLVADLRDAQRAQANQNDAIDAGLADWRNAFAGGKSPPPFYLRIEGSDTPPRTWQTLQQMPLADMFDPVTLFDLGFYYSELDGVGVKYIRYVSFVEDRVLPNLKRDSSVFYIEDRSTLAPEYAANMERLADYARENKRLSRWAGCLVYRIEARRRYEQSCRRADFVLEGMTAATAPTP